MGILASAIQSVDLSRRPSGFSEPASGKGLGAWLLERLHRRAQKRARLAVIERITLAPGQTLALVEVDGQRLLVASSAEGSPAFYPIRSKKAVAEDGRL